MSFPLSAIVFFHNGEDKNFLMKIAACGFSLAHSLQWRLLLDSGYVPEKWKELRKLYIEDIDKSRALEKKVVATLHGSSKIDTSRVTEIHDMYQVLQWPSPSILFDDEIRTLVDSEQLSEQEKTFLAYEKTEMSGLFDHKLSFIIFLEPGSSITNPNILRRYLPFNLFDMSKGGPVEDLRRPISEYAKEHDLCLTDNYYLRRYIATLRHTNDRELALIMSAVILNTDCEEQFVREFIRAAKDPRKSSILVRPGYKLISGLQTTRWGLGFR